MKTKSILSILIVAFISILFFSCDNNMVNYSDVSGKIYSNNNFLPAANVKVTIGDAFTRTSSDGSFRINNVSYPYNISVLDSQNRKVRVFKKLSTDKVYLTLENHFSAYYHTEIHVRVPDSLLTNGKRAKVIFTDGEYVNAYANVANNSLSFLNVYLSDNNPVIGKLLLLTYKLNSFGNIYSYENFGLKSDIIVNSGIAYNFTFDSTEIAFDPGEEIISGSVTLPADYNETLSDYFLSFSNKHIMDYNGYLSFGKASGILYDLIVPTGLPVHFTTYVSKQFWNGQKVSSETYPVYPNYPNVFEMKLPPDLLTPENNATNVNDATLFSFSEGEGNGIYEVTLFDQSNNTHYRIITASNNFTLDDIDQSGFGSVYNHEFQWDVIKIGVYNSINEYAKDKFSNSNSFFNTAGYRFFYTQP